MISLQKRSWIVLKFWRICRRIIWNLHRTYKWKRNTKTLASLSGAVYVAGGSGILVQSPGSQSEAQQPVVPQLALQSQQLMPAAVLTLPANGHSTTTTIQNNNTTTATSAVQQEKQVGRKSYKNVRREMSCNLTEATLVNCWIILSRSNDFNRYFSFSTLYYRSLKFKKSTYETLWSSQNSTIPSKHIHFSLNLHNTRINWGSPFDNFRAKAPHRSALQPRCLPRRRSPTPSLIQPKSFVPSSGSRMNWVAMWAIQS